MKDTQEPLLGDAAAGPIRGLTFTPDDRVLVFQRGKNVHVVEMNNGTEKRYPAELHSDVVVLSASGDYLAAGGWVWNTHNWARLNSAPVGSFRYGCFSVFCDERLCAFLRGNSFPTLELYIFDLADSKYSRKTMSPDLKDLQFVAFHPHLSQMLLISTNGTARSIVVPTGEIARKVADMRTEGAWVQEFLVLNDGRESGYWELAADGAWIARPRGDHHSLCERLGVQVTNRFRELRISSSGEVPLQASFSGDRFNLSMAYMSSEKFQGRGWNSTWTRDRRYLVTANENGTVYVMYPHAGMNRSTFSNEDALDILPLISPSVDALQGYWGLSEKGAFHTGGAPGFLRLPANTGAYNRGYQIDCTVRLSKFDPSPALCLGLVLGDANPRLVLDGKWTERMSGLEYINFEGVDKNASRAVGPVFEPDKHHHVRVKATNDGKRNWEVKATVDDRPIVSWQGPEDQLSTRHPQLNLTTPTFFVGTDSKSELEISQFTFTSLSN